MERLLAQTDLFGLLSEPDRHALTASASARLFGDGETIVAQADPASRHM